MEARPGRLFLGSSAPKAARRAVSMADKNPGDPSSVDSDVGLHNEDYFTLGYIVRFMVPWTMAIL